MAASCKMRLYREAYLAFLRADSDMSEYWRVLTEGGITRERLAGPGK